MTHDPRNSRKLSQRDVQALTFIGEGYEVAQYQLHRAVFGGVSAVMVSRFARRMREAGYIAVERWNRIGINRLRLTTQGRDALAARGIPAESLFVPRQPVATKDLAHTLAINDLRVMLRKLNFDAVLPAWALQRRFSPAPPAIPDVLALRKSNGGRAGAVLACEVDMGGEKWSKVFLPKLRALDALLREWCDNERVLIAILTRGSRRAAMITAALDEFSATTLVRELPSANGNDQLSALEAEIHEWAAALTATVQSN
jgi:hypothetical protein